MTGKLACIVIVEAKLRLSKVTRGAGQTAPIYLRAKIAKVECIDK